MSVHATTTTRQPYNSPSCITKQAEKDEDKDIYCDHSPMLKTASYTSYHLTHRSPSHYRAAAAALNLSHTVSLPLHAPFHSSAQRSMEANKVAEYKKAGNRKDDVPKHEMVHFKGLMSEKRAFGDFRTVLHTGLYSQIVAMEVPVGGDIGDEVSSLA